MTQVKHLNFRQVASDHDKRPFVQTNNPYIVLLPDGEGGFDVRNCPNAEKLARRLRNLPLLEAFFLNHASPGEDMIKDLDTNMFMGRPLSDVVDLIRQNEDKDTP